jgi:hypothetical protein
VLARYEPPGASRESVRGSVMVVVLLLVIIAIMLFGSAAVIKVAQRGFVMLLAGVAGIAALIAVTNSWDRSTEVERQIIVGVPLGAVFLLLIAAVWFSDPPAAKARAPQAIDPRKAAADAVWKRYDNEIGRMSEADRADVYAYHRNGDAEGMRCVIQRQRR